MIVNEIAKFWKPPIAAEQLLRVAELVQDLLVAFRAGASRGVVPFPSALLLSVMCQRHYALPLRSLSTCHRCAQRRNPPSGFRRRILWHPDA